MDINIFQFFITCKRTSKANNATYYVQLSNKRRESSKRNYYIMSPRVIIKAMIIIGNVYLQVEIYKYIMSQVGGHRESAN